MPEVETIEFLQKRFTKENISLGDDEAKYLIQCAAEIPYYTFYIISHIKLLIFVKLYTK